MRQYYLKDLTGKVVRDWYDWLKKSEEGCASFYFADTAKYRYCVCMGWQSGYGPASDEKWFGKDGKLRPAFCPPVDPKEADKGWRICWKIGRQTWNNIMQCDYDIDFEMPYVTEKMAKADPELCEGDVDDTNEAIVLKRGKVLTKGRNGYIDSLKLGAPVGYRDWNALAAYMRKTARRVFKDWKDNDE